MPVAEAVRTGIRVSTRMDPASEFAARPSGAKYLAARDASSGDRVMAENLLQHADHYYRVLNEAVENNRDQRHPARTRPAALRQRPERGDRKWSDEAVPARPPKSGPPMPDGAQNRPARRRLKRPNWRKRRTSSGEDAAEETDTKPSE